MGSSTLEMSTIKKRKRSICERRLTENVHRVTTLRTIHFDYTHIRKLICQTLHFSRREASYKKRVESRSAIL